MSDWMALLVEVDAAMREWRREHPRATLTEIERALDEHWAKARAKIMSDVAQASPAADFGGAGAERPRCPDCGGLVQARGEHTRRLRTHGDQELHLKRDYAECPQCGAAFFPSG
jgi:ribosomal protein S27AE